MKKTHQSLLKKQKIGENVNDDTTQLGENTILDHIWYKRTYKQFFTRKELYRPLFFITFLSLIQQFSGMTVIRSYVVKIFNGIGNLISTQTYFFSPFENLLFSFGTYIDSHWAAKTSISSISRIKSFYLSNLEHNYHFEFSIRVILSGKMVEHCVPWIPSSW